MIVIAMVCSLSFCEKPMIKEKEKPKIMVQEKEKTETKSEADPQGFGGMF